MLRCNKCGKANKDSSTFCTGCGSNILAAAPPVPAKEEEIAPPLKDVISNEFLCSQCGKQNKQNTKFCTSCGNRLAALPQPDLQNENAPVSETTKKENLCTQCGKQNKESAKFCIVCGNNLSLSKGGSSINNQDDTDSKKPGAELDISFSTEVKSATQDIIDSNVTHYKNKIEENDNRQSLGIDRQIKPDTNEEVNNPVMQSSSSKANEQNQHYNATQNEKVWVQGESNYISVTPSTEEENDSPPSKYKRKKIIFWTIGILVLAGLGSLLLFGSRLNLFSNKKISDNQQDIQPEVVPKAIEGNSIQGKDSVTPEASTIDSTVKISAENITVKPADSITTPPAVKNANKIVTIEAPTPPTLQAAINDLTGQGISKDLVFTKNAKVLAYQISKKTLQQCIVVITFKLENSNVKYTATLIYKNIDGSFIYENNTSYFKTLPANEKTLPANEKEESPPTSATDYNVKGDLINYLKGKKVFNGIKYNDVSEIVITNVHEKEYYAEYGNTSYQVDLTINNISSKCQVNYTIDGKFYVNPLR